MIEPRLTPAEVDKLALAAVAKALEPDAERTVCIGGVAPCFLCGAITKEECRG